MNKKTLAALALSTALFTNIYGSSCQINSGAYVGLSAGMAHLAGKMDTSTGIQIGAPLGAYSNNAPAGLSQTSAAGSIFAGYGMNLNNFWVAAELYYQFDQLNYKKELTLTGHPITFSVKVKSGGAWGGNAHLGYVFNKNCILYAIIGAEARRFKLSFVNTDIINFTAQSFDKSYTSVAFAPGLGVRISVGKNWAVRTEYKCALHRNKNVSGSGANPGGGDDQADIKLKPQVHSINVGLIYSF